MLVFRITSRNRPSGLAVLMASGHIGDNIPVSIDVLLVNTNDGVTGARVDVDDDVLSIFCTGGRVTAEHTETKENKIETRRRKRLATTEFKTRENTRLSER